MKLQKLLRSLRSTEDPALQDRISRACPPDWDAERLFQKSYGDYLRASQPRREYRIPVWRMAGTLAVMTLVIGAAAVILPHQQKPPTLPEETVTMTTTEAAAETQPIFDATAPPDAPEPSQPIPPAPTTPAAPQATAPALPSETHRVTNAGTSPETDCAPDNGFTLPPETDDGAPDNWFTLPPEIMPTHPMTEAPMTEALVTASPKQTEVVTPVSPIEPTDEIHTTSPKWWIPVVDPTDTTTTTTTTTSTTTDTQTRTEVIL